MDRRGAKYLLFTLELTTTTLALSFSAACLITAAYIFALKVSNDELETFRTLLTP